VGLDVAGDDACLGLGGGYTLRPNLYIGGTYMYLRLPIFTAGGESEFLHPVGDFDAQSTKPMASLLAVRSWRLARR